MIAFFFSSSEIRMSTFMVKVIAKPRTVHGTPFNSFWSAGKCWSAEEVTEAELTLAQLQELQYDEREGHPIRVVSFIEIGDESNIQVVETTTMAPEGTTTLPASTTTEKLLVPAPTTPPPPPTETGSKPPWMT